MTTPTTVIPPPTFPTLSRKVPDLDDNDWKKIDTELLSLQSPLHHLMGMDAIPSDIAMDQYTELLTNFLSSRLEFQPEGRSHHPRPPSTTIPEARKLKNDLRKKSKRKDATDEDRKNFHRAQRTLSFLLRKEKEKKSKSDARKQETAYRKDFFKFAKAAANGGLDKDEETPTFSKEGADDFYKGRYSQPVNIDISHLDWFAEVAPPTVPYDSSPITPKEVKDIFRSKSPTTAPGEDGLLYGVLAKLPAVHHFLATHYNKTQASSLAPKVWAGSIVKLCHKAGSTNDPSNFRPLALSSCLGKPYHQIKAARLNKFMVSNGYINTSHQKAFLEGINGCMEHIKVLQEIIQDAKAKRRTVHISWFDLTDAFGSVSHELIQFCLNHFHVPEAERKYIHSLYSQLSGKISTKDWISDIFRFLKGIFQGDPYSPSIFLVIFQPLIDFIQSHKNSHGYQLGNCKVLTTPFADDFDLISNNFPRHQKLQVEVQKKAESMGLTFKPSKCRSLSIKGGRVSSDCTFFLLDGNGEKVFLKTMEDDPHKFLGSTITHMNSPADHFLFLKGKLEEKLSNVDSTLVRGEYKVAIYSRYILPSLQFHFTVHNIHQTHLDLLDNMAKKFLKSWLSFPKRGATDLGIFHPQLLGIKYPSQVYMESHMVNHIALQLSKDPVVKEATACQLEREGAWSRKSSTAVECHQLYQQLSEKHTIPSAENCQNYEAALRHQVPKLKKAGKTLVKEKYLSRAKVAAGKLETQGAMASLLAEEEASVPWQSLIYAVPKGVMSWAARASTNCLASPDNLARWKKIVDAKCPLCSITPCTLGHLLSNCKEALNRYEWRHNNIVHYLLKEFAAQGLEGRELYADLDGKRINGVTLPPDVAMTAQKPDLVIINRKASPPEVILVELTIPWDTSANMGAALQRKTARYEDLQTSIEGNGFKCSNLPLEIGTRGLINAKNKSLLAHLCNIMKVKKVSKVIQSCSKLAVLGSFTIWNARHSADWNGGGYLAP